MGGHGALILGLRHPEKFRSVSAFSPIVNPLNCPWGQKAFSGYLGEDRLQWRAHDATELVKGGHRHPSQMKIDQGTGDEFLEKQLLTNNFALACQASGVSVDVQYREGYDHSYYFISSFIESHILFHIEALAKLPPEI